ncbi:hypothetical protein [Acidimangrovimonas sediminis]|uniref:hypothetical protein n=1 Tax=Acidimangrovimonas sediminis TaxID=2056283 RepID=UPI000C806269|nr:hypothetical protein [Acidimangrovimonas sediminis]
MYQILYQGGHGSHGPRAQALANVTPGAQCGDIATTPARPVQGLTTLAFWGHGDSFQLCNKSAREIHEVIKEWKAVNPGLGTVEIITCNARHCTTGDSFANQLKHGIGWRSSLKGLTIKALPTTVGGKRNAWSILLAETIRNSWVYITAPGATDSLLMEANSLIQYEKMPSGGLRSFNGDIAMRADKVVREHPMRQWTMNYGYMNTLRAHLGVV